MVVFYADESGTGLKDLRTPVFVLVALAVPATEYQQLDEAVPGHLP